MSLDSLIIYESNSIKTRLGSENDGGYVIADGLVYDCLLSCGIANDITFETEFLKRHDIPCYAFDGTIDALPNKTTNIRFVKKNISYYNSDTTTNLFDIIEQYNNIFLKMDIETFEYRWLQVLSYEQLKKIKQINIEFHFPFTEPGFNHLDAPLPISQKMDVLAKLIETHTLIHLHANNCCGTTLYNNIIVPNVFECTYVRNDFQTRDKLNRESLPTSLDTPNVDGPDINLIGYPFNLDKVIVISQPWGGLGDNLQFSTLPKLYSDLGYEVFISYSNICRNDEMYDLIWKKNPYIKGITRLPPNAGACKGLNYYTEEAFKNVELTHGLTLGTCKYPQVYYTPNKIPELNETIIVDLTSISSSYTDSFINELINIINTQFPNMPKKQLRFKKIENTSRIVWDILDVQSIYHYSDIIASCNTFICLHSGGAVLGSALKQDNTSPNIVCFHHTRPSRKGLMYYFDNISYIYLNN